jgi:hypothetical protein
LNKKDIVCRYYAHGYMLCSIVGYILLLPAYNFSLWLVGIGATSIYISIGIILTASVSKFWGICALGWLILFPIVLSASYFFALRNRFRLLWVAVGLDTFISFCYAIYTVLTSNRYGFALAIIDVILSVGVLFGVYCIIRKLSKK